MEKRKVVLVIILAVINTMIISSCLSQKDYCDIENDEGDGNSISLFLNKKYYKNINYILVLDYSGNIIKKCYVNPNSDKAVMKTKFNTSTIQVDSKYTLKLFKHDNTCLLIEIVFIKENDKIIPKVSFPN